MTPTSIYKRCICGLGKGKSIYFEIHFCDKCGLHSQILFLFRYLPLLCPFPSPLPPLPSKSFLCFFTFSLKPVLFGVSVCVCVWIIFRLFCVFCIFRGFLRNSLFNKISIVLYLFTVTKALFLFSAAIHLTLSKCCLVFPLTDVFATFIFPSVVNFFFFCIHSVYF